MVDLAIRQRRRLPAPGWTARAAAQGGHVYLTLSTWGTVSALTWGLPPGTRWASEDELIKLLEGFGPLLPYYNELEIMEVDV